MIASRAALMLAVLEQAGQVPSGSLERTMARAIGLPPTAEEKVKTKAAKRKRKAQTGPRCPSCRGIMATDSPCMRRSCKAFSGSQRRW